MKRICTTAALLLAAVLLAPALSAAPGDWIAFDDEHYISGPKLTAKDLKGKVVLVDMWAIWCYPCRRMLPHTQKIWEEYKNRPVAVVASHVGGGYDEAKVRDFLASGGFTFSFYLTSRWEGKTGFDGGIPFLYVIDGKGECVYGGRDPEAVRQALDKALSKLSTAPNLLSDESFLNEYKSLKGQLVLGKPVTAALKRLKDDVKAAEQNPSSQTFARRKTEALQIAKLVNERKQELVKSINGHIAAGEKDEAIKEIDLLVGSWPGLKKEWQEKRSSLAGK